MHAVFYLRLDIKNARIQRRCFPVRINLRCGWCSCRPDNQMCRESARRPRPLLLRPIEPYRPPSTSRRLFFLEYSINLLQFFIIATVKPKIIKPTASAIASQNTNFTSLSFGGI